MARPNLSISEWHLACATPWLSASRRGGRNAFMTKKTGGQANRIPTVVADLTRAGLRRPVRLPQMGYGRAAEDLLKREHVVDGDLLLGPPVGYGDCAGWVCGALLTCDW